MGIFSMERDICNVQVTSTPVVLNDQIIDHSKVYYCDNALYVVGPFSCGVRIRVILEIYKSCDIRDCYIGVVDRMNSEGKVSGKELREARMCGPVIQPSDFSGSGDWTMWIRKFQCLAELYTWSDSENSSG